MKMAIARLAILLSDTIDFKSKPGAWDKENWAMIKGSIHKKDITITNVYVPHLRAPKYVQQLLTELKAETDSSTRMIGKFHDPLSPVDGTSRLKINKESGHNDTTDHMHVTNRSFHAITKHTFFSSTHRTFSRREHARTQNKS